MLLENITHKFCYLTDELKKRKKKCVSKGMIFFPLYVEWCFAFIMLITVELKKIQQTSIKLINKCSTLYCGKSF